MKNFFDYHKNEWREIQEEIEFPTTSLEAACMMRESIEVLGNKGGMKRDEQKPEFDRLSFDALSEMNAVHKFGDGKYEKGNWKKGLHIDRLLNAAIRHISSVLKRDFNDEESGRLHSAHAAVCLEMVTHYLIHKKDYEEFVK